MNSTDTIYKALLTLICTAMLTLGAIGCGDDDGRSSGGVGDAVEAASELLDPVQAALEAPTGSVNASNVEQVLLGSQAYAMASKAAGYASPAGAPGAGTQGGSPTSCMDIQGATVVFDMACMTGGSVTGSMTMLGGQDGDALILFYQYHDVCSADRAMCMSGDFATAITGADSEVTTIVEAGAFDMTVDGETVHVTFGARSTLTDDGLSMEYVVFAGGESFVLSATLNGQTGSLSIAGANGVFECSYQHGGASGSCSASGDSFDWGS